MEIAGPWLLFCALVGFYARHKGRSGIGFFVLSIFITPLFGFILALIVKPNAEVVDQRDIESGKSKKCPQCAEVVKKEANICRHCGSELKTEPEIIPINKNYMKGVNNAPINKISK